MIEKLRSRHPVDLPVERWGRSKGLLTILGGIAFLFLVVPLGIALYAGALTVPLSIAASVGALLLVWVVGAARGKPGFRRH